MAPINRSWPSFQGIDLDSDHAKKIAAVLENADFAYLCSKAVDFRGQCDTGPSINCSIDTTKFISGTFNVVVALEFSDSVQWVARILLPQGKEEGTDENDLFESMLSEIATMNLVRTRTKIPVPRVFGYELSTSLLGYPYMLMEALPGKVLDSRFASSVPEQYKRKVAAQFAQCIHELSTIRFDRIGRVSYSSEHEKNNPELLQVSPFPIIGYPTNVGPFSTSLEYFYYFRKGQTRSILQDHGGEAEWEAATWLLDNTVTSMVTDEYVHGPFPLCHLDLHYNNILFDDDYNITGVIDWSHAQSVPIERFVISPEFIAPPAAPAAVKQAIFDFRDMFVEAWRNIDTGKPPSSNEIQQPHPSKLVSSSISELVYRCTCSFPWRAIFDARLALRLLYGENAKWEDFQKFHSDRSV